MVEQLNPTQRNSLLVSLRGFEERLRGALFILDGAEMKGILINQTLKLPPERTAEARQEIASALTQIRELSELYHLEAVEQDLGQQLAGEMSISWESLLEASAKRMKKYGAVHARVAERLAPRIESLSSSALKLAHLFGKDAPNE